MRQTIVIVGRDSAGTVLAVELLRRPPAQPTQIVLIERGAAMARGVAYAAHDTPYVLNVPAGRRDWWILRIRWIPAAFAREIDPEADAEDFMPRAMYGDYLGDVLDRAERAAPTHVTLTRLFGEVMSFSRVARGEKPLRANLAGRNAIAADRVCWPRAIRCWRCIRGRAAFCVIRLIFMIPGACRNRSERSIRCSSSAPA